MKLKQFNYYLNKKMIKWLLNKLFSARYNIYLKNNNIRVIKEGFSWIIFFLGIWGLIYLNLWEEAIVSVVVFILLTVCASIIKMDIINILIFLTTINLIYWFAWGICINNILENKLIVEGYYFIQTIKAITKKQAIKQYLKHQHSYNTTL